MKRIAPIVMKRIMKLEQTVISVCNFQCELDVVNTQLTDGQDGISAAGNHACQEYSFIVKVRDTLDNEMFKMLFEVFN